MFFFGGGVFWFSFAWRREEVEEGGGRREVGVKINEVFSSLTAYWFPNTMSAPDLLPVPQER